MNERLTSLLDKKTLQKINLSNQSLSMESAKNLAKIIENNQWITHLNLYNTQLNDEKLIDIAKVLSNHSNLKCVHLGGNQITEKGWEALFNALSTNQSLIEINLCFNKIDNKTMDIIGEKLKSNTRIETLILSNNAITDSAINSFAEMLTTNNALKLVNLSNNNISDQVAISLALALRVNSKKINLYLNSNDIHNLGALELFYSVKLNTLLKVYLNHNPCNVISFEKYVKENSLQERALISSKKTAGININSNDFLELIPLIKNIENSITYIAIKILNFSRYFLHSAYKLFPDPITKSILTLLDQKNLLTEKQLKDIFNYASDKTTLVEPISRKNFLTVTQCDRVLKPLKHYHFLNSISKEYKESKTKQDSENFLLAHNDFLI